jgi:rod shape-determining protein MreD
MINDLINIAFRFVVLILVQVLILNNILVGGFINPYLYVLFILLFPLESPKLLLLVLAFFLGLGIDMFSNTMGMHAAASVFMAFCRPYFLKLIAPRDGYDFERTPSIQAMGLKWFLTYTGILVLLHHAVLFYTEVFRLNEFFHTLLRVVLSSSLTIILILITQYLFYYKTRTQR